MFVVKEPSDVPEWLKLTAALGGFFLMSHQFFDTGAKRGECLKYKPWISMNKQVFISEAFRENHAEYTKVLLHAASAKISKTKIMAPDKKEQHLTRARAATLKGTGTRFVFLICKDERKDFRGITNTVNKLKFNSMVSCVDTSLSLTGLGGR